MNLNVGQTVHTLGHLYARLIVFMISGLLSIGIIHRLEEGGDLEKFLLFLTGGGRRFLCIHNYLGLFAKRRRKALSVILS